MPFNVLHIEFPRFADLIAGLRMKDDRFDEICSDYELMLSDYQHLRDARSGGQRISLADVEETLAALRDEIASALD